MLCGRPPSSANPWAWACPPVNMLRVRTEANRSGEPALSTAADVEVPGIDQPYSTGERPPGVRFYRGRTSFWLPYFLLQGMRYEAEKVTLQFASEDVVIDGRGLHGLYVELARQAVARVVEQGERYASISDAATHVTRISEIPRTRE